MVVDTVGDEFGSVEVSRLRIRLHIKTKSAQKRENFV